MVVIDRIPEGVLICILEIRLASLLFFVFPSFVSVVVVAVEEAFDNSGQPLFSSLGKDLLGCCLATVRGLREEGVDDVDNLSGFCQGNNI